MKKSLIICLLLLSGIVLTGFAPASISPTPPSAGKVLASHATPAGFYTTVTLNPTSARDNETVTITANICERRGQQDCIDHASQSLPPLRCDFYRSTPGQP